MARFYENIEAPLHGEMENPGSLREYDWIQLRNDVKPFLQENRMQLELNTLMQPFYMEYVYARENYTQGNHFKRMFIKEVFKTDALAGEWAYYDVDVLKMTERWMLYGDEREFKDLLTALVSKRYKTGGEVRKHIDEILRRLEVEGSRKGEANAGTFYCLLHGFTMIMGADLSFERKQNLLSLFLSHWDFLRYVYSVMLRCIVGCRFANFVSVANNVANTAIDEPYLHLFYAPLKERFDDLCKRGTKKEKLEKSVMRLEEKMKQSTPSDELNELCELLFPDEFRDMLNRHRPKSYLELEGEIDHIKQEMQGTIEVLNEQINALAAQLSAAVNASVPIIEIEHELLQFPGQQAWPIFMQLNTLLMENEAWKLASLAIRNRILAKLNQELQLNMSITAQAGSYVNGVVQQQTNHGIEANRQISA